MNEKKKKIAAYSAVSLIIAGILFYIYFFYRAYLFAFLICTGMGIITSLAAYYLFKRRFLGGLRGAMIIAVIGAVTGAFSLDFILMKILFLLRWLMASREFSSAPPVNTIAVLLGSMLFLAVYSRISPR